MYIFSQDILHEEKLLSTDTVWLKKGDCYADDVLRVHAFGSTDVGISFLVEAEGKKIFHAGDLNNWHWMDEAVKLNGKDMSGIIFLNWIVSVVILAIWMS